MKRITELWLAGTAPARDGLYRVDGLATAVDVDGPELSWFDLGPPLDLDDVLADPDHVMKIDIFAEAELPDGSVVCGDGAHGSEGFFARLDADGALVWIVPLGDSNPFMKVKIDGATATFTNNLDNSITVDLDSPQFALSPA
jgi:hypothetical protein